MSKRKWLALAVTVVMMLGLIVGTAVAVGPVEPVFVYGVEGISGDIYEIDVANGIEEKIFEGVGGYDAHYPNALAFDNANNRLYFAINNSELFFIDVSEDPMEMVKAGDFEHGSQRVYSGTFGGGHYWYIPDYTQTLVKVSFDGDGMITESESISMTVLDGNLGPFGDIAYDNGFIFGCDSSYFFSYNISNGTFTNLGTDARYLQLAYGSDGVLYGHNYPARAWYSVDTDAGVKSALLFTGAIKYWDLAAGRVKPEVPCDTATGLGERIRDRGSWFMYNEYTEPGGTQCFDLHAGNPKDFYPEGSNIVGSFCVADNDDGTFTATYNFYETIEIDGWTYDIVVGDMHLAISDEMDFRGAPGRDANAEWGVPFEADAPFYIFAHFEICYE